MDPFFPDPPPKKKVCGICKVSVEHDCLVMRHAPPCVTQHAEVASGNVAWPVLVVTWT